MKFYSSATALLTCMFGLLIATVNGQAHKPTAHTGYILGFESGATKYWKNGQAHILNVEGNNFGSGMALIGGDLYLSDGSYDDKPSKVWKNGELTTLQGLDPATRISTLANANGKLCLTGTHPDNTTFYWINGKSHPLESGFYANLNATVVTETAIYTCGDNLFNNSGAAILRYWKNGKVTNLEVDSGGSTLYAIAVKGSDVYVGGPLTDGNKLTVAAYWKNGNKVFLTDGSNYAQLRCLKLSGTTVYAAGTEAKDSIDVAKYWKNGVPTSLSNGKLSTEVMDMAIDGKDLYFLCLEWQANGIKRILLYKNGVPTYITDGKKDAVGAKICVSSR